ncbi:MAG: NosD domain-containing protein [Candidatus Nealsonbacteria bacterium]
MEIIAVAIDTDPKVHVDDNWTETAAAYDWCTGLGTYEDPYVIKNLIIDANQSDSCILIENTEEYFVIENCTVFNFGKKWKAGIELSYVGNGTIIHNTVYKAFLSWDNGFGIYLCCCSNITISDNNCTRNSYGICFDEYSYNNTITGNNCTGNYYNGIRIHWSKDNTITGNTCTRNLRGIGICLSFSDSNTITGSNCTDNYYDGIHLYSSNSNTITVNNCTGNNNYGIYLGDHSNYNTIIGNNCTRNHKGILLSYSNNNTITGNNCTNNGDGIYLHCSNSNTITGNNCTGNNYGINLQRSNSNSIIGNNCTGNGGGISLFFSNSSTIIGNNCTDNNQGIELSSSNSNTITGNNCTRNWYGIYLSSSSNNTITENNCTRNYKGIRLSSSHNNTVTGNNCTRNDYDGINLYYSNNNEVANNFLIKNGHTGICDDGANNTIYNNTYLHLPHAFFEVTAAEGYFIQFTDRTTEGRYPLTYQWNFGDGSANSTVQNPIHKYNSDGIYIVVLMVTDADGDVSVYSREINVLYDTPSPPALHAYPNDVTYEEGTTGHNISWTATDLNPGTYKIYRDGLEIDSGTWESGIAITINVDGLAIGSYNYTIVATDAFGNVASDTVWVTVEDSDGDDIPPDDTPPDDITPDDTTPDDTTPDLDIGIILLVLVSLIGAAGVAAIIIFLKRRQH